MSRAGNTALRESNLLLSDYRRSHRRLQASLAKRLNRPALIDALLPRVLAVTLAQGFGRGLGK